MAKKVVILIYLSINVISLFGQDSKFKQDTFEISIKLALEICTDKGFNPCSNGKIPGSFIPKLIKLDKLNFSNSYSQDIYFLSDSKLLRDFNLQPINLYKKLMDSFGLKNEYAIYLKKIKKRFNKAHRKNMRRINKKFRIHYKDNYFNGTLTYGLFELKIKYLTPIETNFTILDLKGKSKYPVILDHKCLGYEIIEIISVKPLSSNEYFIE